MPPPLDMKIVGGTHEHRALEQRRAGRFAAVGDQVVSDGAGAGRLTPQADLGWVATEEGDVPLDPLEDGALVPEGGVGRRLLLDRVAGEPAEEAELGDISRDLPIVCRK
jgi:hypothetical protein